MTDITVKVGEVYLHHSGRRYMILEIVNKAHPSDRFPITAIYIGGDGHTWARPVADFTPDKFKLMREGIIND